MFENEMIPHKKVLVSFPLRSWSGRVHTVFYWMTPAIFADRTRASGRWFPRSNTVTWVAPCWTFHGRSYRQARWWNCENKLSFITYISRIWGRTSYPLPPKNKQTNKQKQTNKKHRKEASLWNFQKWMLLINVFWNFNPLFKRMLCVESGWNWP